MREFTFCAGDKKDEMIMGLSFPFLFMMPILFVFLIGWKLFPDINFLSSINNNFLLEYVLIIPFFNFASYMMKHIRNMLIHNYNIQINKHDITIFKDDKTIELGKIESIDMNDRNSTVIFTIHAERDYTFILRNNKNKLFNNCSQKDLEIIRDINKYLNQVIIDMKHINV